MRGSLQGLTHLHPGTTLTSIDGMKALDSISRDSLLMGFTRDDGGQAAVQFVRLCCQNVARTVHRIPQGEGG